MSRDDDDEFFKLAGPSLVAVEIFERPLTCCHQLTVCALRLLQQLQQHLQMKLDTSNLNAVPHCAVCL